MYCTACVNDIRRYGECCRSRWSWAHVTKMDLKLLTPREQLRPPVLSVRRRILMTTALPKMFGWVTSVFRYHLFQALTFSILQFAEMRSMTEWLFHGFYQELSGTSRHQHGIPPFACTAFRAMNPPTPRTMEIIQCFQRDPKVMSIKWMMTVVTFATCWNHIVIDSMRRCRQIPSLELWW